MLGANASRNGREVLEWRLRVVFEIFGAVVGAIVRARVLCDGRGGPKRSLGMLFDIV